MATIQLSYTRMLCEVFSFKKMATIQLSYTRMLCEVFSILQTEAPQVMVNVDTQGRFVGSIVLRIPRSENVIEYVTVSTVAFPTSAAAEQDVARLALKKLKEECGFQIRDLIYDD